ncbi:MAG: hypothetical protein IPL23_27970 [Saprospiraceae bacterium]|nr:hypothetical protein [Saprospiraceae bacterium]
MNDSRSKNSSSNGLPTMSKKLWKLLSLLFIILCCHNSFGQVPDQTNKRAEIVISGARFTGDLMKHWIKEYEAGNPQVKFVLEDKGTVEFSEADIIIHGHQPSKAQIYENRTYISFARFAVLPIANVNSPFAKAYAEKGLKKSELKQAYFYNPLDRIDEKPLKVEFNAYSRIQQASAPIVFAKTFGYEQTDLHGRLISGTDKHLVQSVIKDPLGISYAPVALIYDLGSGILKEGLIVIPIDADDNGKVTSEEKAFNDLSSALNFISNNKYKNLPVSDIQFSIKKQGTSQAVNRFLTWVLSKGINDLQDFGFLKQEEKTIEQNLSDLSKNSF